MHLSKRYLFFDCIFAVLTLSLCLLEDSTDYLPLVGYVFVPLSLYMLYKCRNNRFLACLMVVVAVINVSIGTHDFINRGEGISRWQSFGMRMSACNFVAAKTLLVFNATLNFFLNGKLCGRLDGQDLLHDARSKNWIAAYALLALLVGILGYAFVFEFGKHAQGYASVSSPIYEYSVLLYILAWFSARDSKLLACLLMVYACVFVILFLAIGDRSSASMYILFSLLVHYRGKLKSGRLLSLALLGLLGVNAIAITRNGIASFSELGTGLWQRGFYTDTASWAYYSSITVLAAGIDYGHPFQMFFGFLAALFGFKNEFGNLQGFARNYAAGYLNRGGNLFPTDFAVWFGDAGPVVAAIIVGWILHKLFGESKGIKLYYKLLVIVFVVRWYVYTPICFFRSIFLIGGVAYLACSMGSAVFAKHVKKKEHPR